MTNQDETMWSIAEGKMNSGKPYILRFREFYPTETEQKKYPFLIEIIWNYQESDVSGMPDEETYRKMVIFEDVLDEELEVQNTIMMASITGEGKKIWQFYVTDTDSFMDEFNLMMDGKEALPLDFEIFQDEDWNGYKEVVSWIE